MFTYLVSYLQTSGTPIGKDREARDRPPASSCGWFFKIKACGVWCFSFYFCEILYIMVFTGTSDVAYFWCVKMVSVGDKAKARTHAKTFFVQWK